MNWFYVEKSQIKDGYIQILGSDVNHIKNVLRMKIGERVAICDGEGTDYYCTLEEVNAKEIIAKIEEMNDTQTELPSKIYLFQGIPKKDKMDFIIQKAVELGVHEVIPVAMKRCVAKIEDHKKEEKRLERWQSIAMSAAKQSGRGVIPKIHSVVKFQEALSIAKKLDAVIVPYELAGDIKNSYDRIKEACFSSTIGIFIGPEGGFDDLEISMAREAGFQEITLGKRILRTETAGMTMLSILMFELELRTKSGLIE